MVAWKSVLTATCSSVSVCGTGNPELTSTLLSTHVPSSWTGSAGCAPAGDGGMRSVMVLGGICDPSDRTAHAPSEGGGAPESIVAIAGDVIERAGL